MLQPLTLQEVSVYQDAAIFRWKVDPSLKGGSLLVSWCPEGELGVLSRKLPTDTDCCTLEGLQPGTRYHFSIQIILSARERYSLDGDFATKVLRGGTFPYIYLSGATRNVDGSFPPGSKIPLRVFNATEVHAVEWTLDGTRIEPEADGRYTLRRSGILRARIEHLDGTVETLYKEITVQ